MNLLEERYRHTLRLLPASYRAEWEDEMVATFMDAAGEVSDEDNPKPRWSEAFSVAALAMRVRLGGGVGASPRSVAWGDAVRLAALAGLLVLAASACVGVVGLLRLYLFGPPGTVPFDRYDVLGKAGTLERLRSFAGLLQAVAWIAAYVALVRGRRRVSQVLAVLALMPVLYGAGTSFTLVPRAGFDVLAHSLPVAVVVLALLAGFHRDAPPPAHRGRWLAALPVGAVLLFGLNLLPLALGGDLQIYMGVWLGSGGGRYSLFLAAAGVAYLVVHAYAPARRAPSWPLALALATVPVFVTQAAAAPFWLGTVAPEAEAIVAATQIVAVTQAVAVAALGSALAVLSARMLRSLDEAPRSTPQQRP